MSGELIPSSGGPAAVIRSAGANPAERLLELAVEKGLGVAGLEKLVALHERFADRDAAREFVEAMAAFQEACPPIRKTSTAKVTTKNGGSYTYQYAELDEIARTVRPLLHKHGLSYTWDSTLSESGDRIRVSCTISHVNGHKASATFESSTKALTQAMSPQQEVASALTFGRRQTLIQALGLTTCDPDEDGAEPGERFTPEQVLVIEALIDQRPEGSRARLLSYLGVSALEDIPADRFEWLKSDLEQKIKAQR